MWTGFTKRVPLCISFMLRHIYSVMMVDSHILSVLGFVWRPCHLKLVIFEQSRPRVVADGQSVDELGSCAKDHYKSLHVNRT